MEQAHHEHLVENFATAIDGIKLFIMETIQRLKS